MISHDCPRVEISISHAIQLETGDLVFVSSDGFIDNFDINLLLLPTVFETLKKSSAKEIQETYLKFATEN
jgi:hypothetical protein